MTTPTTPETVAELLPVTKEDREAAADYLEYVELLPDAIIRMVRIGKPVDHALSLHMARHRLDAEARAVAPGREKIERAVAETIERCARVAGAEKVHWGNPPYVVATVDRVIRNIRALSPAGIDAAGEGGA